MIRNYKEIESFEREFQRKTEISIADRYKIFNSLYQHARSLGLFSEIDKNDGLEHTVELAQKLNSNGSKTFS